VGDNAPLVMALPAPFRSFSWGRLSRGSPQNLVVIKAKA
jgi:hypothetical protein